MCYLRVTTQPFFISAVGGNKSVAIQHLHRMCKVYREHEEEESKRGHWVGRRRKRKTAVIRAERHSKCRRMQVVPVVLDEVLFSCWATKLFIYKTVTAYGHGRENCYTYCSFCPVDVWLQSFCSQWWIESEVETHKSQPGLPAIFWLINTNDCWLRCHLTVVFLCQKVRTWQSDHCWDQRLTIQSGFIRSEALLMTLTSSVIDGNQGEVSTASVTGAVYLQWGSDERGSSAAFQTIMDKLHDCMLIKNIATDIQTIFFREFTSHCRIYVSLIIYNLWPTFSWDFDTDFINF